jgi:hypothetical protein
MIVVVGAPAWRAGEPGAPAGRTCEVALAAVRNGGRVELVGRVGDDPTGDRLLIALALAGVGHAAVLRDPARSTPVLPEPHAEPDGAPDDPFAAPDDPPPAPPLAAYDGPPLQPADVALGLQYLTAFGVLVLSDDAPASVVPACVEGAAFAGAQVVVLVGGNADLPDGLPEDATVIAVPADDDGSLAALVGRYAARLDAGERPAEAFRASLEEGPPAVV